MKNKSYNEFAKETRRKNFDCEISKAEFPIFDDDIDISFTKDGLNYATITISIKEFELIKNKVSEYLESEEINAN